MAKPIFIALLPESGGKELDELEEQRAYLDEKMPDYHIIFVYSKDIEQVDFKVFYDKDFTETNFEELKQLVRDLCTVKINRAELASLQLTITYLKDKGVADVIINDLQNIVDKANKCIQ